MIKTSTNDIWTEQNVPQSNTKNSQNPSFEMNSKHFDMIVSHFSYYNNLTISQLFTVNLLWYILRQR